MLPGILVAPEKSTAGTKRKIRFLRTEFVIEIASPSNRPAALRAKMEEWREAGLKLGWLVVPNAKTVEVYTPKGTEILQCRKILTDDPVLPGFVLDLEKIWRPQF